MTDPTNQNQAAGDAEKPGIQRLCCTMAETLFDHSDGDLMKVADHAAAIAEIEAEVKRVEQCCICGGGVTEWVEDEKGRGRICRPCEHNDTLAAENARLREEVRSWREDCCCAMKKENAALKEQVERLLAYTNALESFHDYCGCAPDRMRRHESAIKSTREATKARAAGEGE